ncbi:alpha/beta fold hydrolase [Bdellovibrio bacteriovorus]|uniref:alpha/beta fold hydrolase n=1 Tax=Bdellovibrio bacteriovorus TaxID=959 RepID=UPI0035A6B64F
MSGSREWVLIRGIVSEEFHWWDFLPEMKTRFPQDLLHTPDIIGNGKFFEKTTPWRVKPNIEGLRSQVPTNNKKILFGFSLGGMLSLEWAHTYPEEVRAVVLVNSSLNNSPFYRRMTPGAFLNIAKLAAVKDHVVKEERVLKMTSFLPEERIKSMAPVWGERSQKYPLRPTNFLWQLALASQIPQREKPQVPVLVLSSGKDKVVHPSCSERIAKKWNLPLITHPEAGHDLFLDDPHWILNQLQNWLEKEKI